MIKLIPICCILYLCLGMGSIDVAFGENGGHSMSWFFIHPNVCSGCYIVEPNDNYLSYSQLYQIESGETKTLHNYNCYGCDVSDYQKILDEKGLWYYPQGHP